MSQFTTPTTPTGPQAQPEFPLAAEPPLTSVAPVTGDPDYYRKIAALSKANGEWSLNQLTYDVSIDQWTGFQIGRLAARVRASQEDVDPTFDIFSRWDDFTDGVAPAYWEDIARARSEGEANILKAQFQDTTDRRQRIAEAGVAGTVATVAATFMDPPQVAIMLGSGGLGAAIGGARGGFLATRAGMAVSSGLINAGTQLPLDVLRSADDPSFGGGDIAGNFIGNFAFGAQQPLTAGFNRATRFLAGGAAQSLGAPLQFRGEDFSNADAQVAMATQFFFGGAFNAIPAVRNPLIDAEAVRLAKLARDIADEADVNAAVTLRVGTPTPKAQETIVRNSNRRRDTADAVVNFGRTIIQLDAQGAVRPADAPAAQPNTVNPMTDRNNTIITGGDIGPGGTSIAARMAGFSRVSMDASYKPGDYDYSGVTFDSMEGAERVISRMSVFSQGSQIANSDKMPLRLMAAMVMGDMRGENAASGLVQRGARQRQFDSAWGQTRDKAREAYNKQQSEAGLPAVSAGEFDTLVGESYRKMRAGIRSENPHVQSVLDFMVQNQAKGLADSKRKGDASAMDVPDTAMHPNQIWLRDRIDGALETFGYNRVKETLTEGIMPQSRRRVAAAFAERNGDQTLFDFRVADQEQLIEAAARVQAETQADSIIRNGGTQKDVLAQINGIPVEMSVEATIAAYRANPLLRTLSDEQVEALVRQMKQDQAMPPIYRAAIEIDQNYTHRWVEQTFGPGTQGEMRELRIMDMLDNSAEAMMKRWHNAHEGRLAMLELERAYSSVTQPGGGTNDPARQRLFVTPGQFETYMRQQLTGDIGDLASADESALNALRHHVKLLAGAPTYVPGSDRAEGVFRMVNGMSSLTSARVMMNPTAPIQNLTEVATALAHSHPAVVAKAVPELDQLMKALANGVDDPELRHYAFVMGMGQNLASGRPLGLLDDSAPAVVGTGKSTLLKAGQKVQAAGQAAGHYAYKLSGNSSTQDAAEIGVTMIAMKHFRLAADGEIKWRAADLEQFGLSQQRFESIIADMKAHRVKNDLGFYDLNEDKWQPENAAAFRRALLGWTTRYGNVMNAGLMPSYTTNNILGRMLTQLSRFGIQSWQNRALQPAFNVARAAPGHKGEALAMAATSYITQSVGASAAYALGVYLNSIGRPDAEEYRNQMLSKEMLALTLYSRAAWSSLTPRIMDVGLQLAGANSIFAPMRSSGLGTGSGPLGVAGQTPLGSWIYSAFSMPLSIAETLYSEEREWTTRDQRRLEETLLFPSAYLNLRNINAHLYQMMGIPTPEEVRESRESTREFVSPN